MQVTAQSYDFSNIAYPIKINTPKTQVSAGTTESNIIPEGSIVTLKNTGYLLAVAEYDEDMVGVVNHQPSVSYEENNPDKNAYLVTGGLSYILVSNANGPINNGDYITSSTRTGVGVKATTSGKVIGRALEDYDKSTTGRISASIKPEKFDINQNETNISGIGMKTTIGSTTLRLLNIANLFALKEPSRAFRYILAILITILSITFGFGIFGRIVVKGIDGISRNPLAGKLIMISIGVNGVLMLLVSGVGIFLAYLIVVY